MFPKNLSRKFTCLCVVTDFVTNEYFNKSNEKNDIFFCLELNSWKHLLKKKLVLESNQINGPGLRNSPQFNCNLDLILKLPRLFKSFVW